MNNRPVRLLVAMNFSKKSEMAIDFALTHSQSLTTAEVYLFHVIEDSTRDYRRLDRLNEEIVERMRVAMLAGLDRIHGRGATSHVHQVHRRIAHGKPGVEILKMAEGIGADMLLMGAPNSSTFRKLANRIPCTLVLLKDKTQL